MALLTVQGVAKSFGPTLALKGVDFSLEPGEVHALLGENGSGKSTLMRILNGEIMPDGGSMTLRDQPYAPRNPLDAVAHGVTLIHQELAVCNHLTVWENIFLGVEIRTWGVLQVAAMRQKARECLAELGHPDFDVNQLVAGLSPSLRQLVEIARAVRSESSVVLFDEPTSSLTEKDVENLFTVIRRLKELGRGIVYITHFLDEVAVIADRATVLRDGEYISTVSVADTTPDSMASLMVGRDLGQIYHRSERHPGDVLLSAKSASGPKKPSNVSLDIRAGEIVGIAGLNASGRTEFLRALFGLDQLRAGEVSVLGSRHPNPAQSWKAGLGLVSEDRKTEGLALTLSIKENITLPRPGNPLVNEKERDTRSASVIERMGVKCQGPEQAIGALSGGNQQKVAIGRLMDQESRVWLLDEPTRGIDIGSKTQIYKLIDQLAVEGKAVLLVSSQLPELVGLCDRIIVFRRGEAVTELVGPETDTHELMRWCAGA